MFRMHESIPFDSRAVSGMRFGGTLPQRIQARVRMIDNNYAEDDDAELSLLSPSRRKKVDQSFPIMAACVLGLVVLALTGFMGIMYWQFQDGVRQVRDLSRPFVMDAVNHTLSILSNIDHSSSDANFIVEDVHSLTGTAVPALQHALNQSAMIVDRLERLARNPVLQLSLANTGVAL